MSDLGMAGFMLAQTAEVTWQAIGILFTAMAAAAGATFVVARRNGGPNGKVIERARADAREEALQQAHAEQMYTDLQKGLADIKEELHRLNNTLEDLSRRSGKTDPLRRDREA